MNWGILAFVIIYEVLTVLVVGAVIARKNRQAKEALPLPETGCQQRM